MPQTKAEKAAYQRGYQAGLRRLETRYEDRAEKKMLAELERRKTRADRYDAFFCAALTGLLNGRDWTIGEEKVNTIPKFIELASKFAAEAIIRR